MRQFLSFLFVFILLCCLAGCATNGPKFSEMTPSLSMPQTDMGRIYFYRTALLGAAIQPDVKLNGEIIGSAVPNGFFYVDKPSGDYIIETSTEVERRLSLILEPGQTRYVRLNISMGFFVGHVYPELVDNETGEEEIQDCRYIGPK